MQFSLGVLTGVWMGMIGAGCVLANHQSQVNQSAAKRMIKCMQEKQDLESGLYQYAEAVKEVSRERAR